MIDFSLTPQQEEIKKKAHDFAKEYIIPREKILDEKEEFPLEIINKARELDLMNVMIPKEYGGLGYDMGERIIIAEELGWGCSGVAATLLVHDAAIIPLIVAGSHYQKQKYLKKVLDGELFTLALTEPQSGSDLMGIETEAVKMDNKYIINGKKTLISNIRYSNYIITLAKIKSADNSFKVAPFIISSKAEGVIKSHYYEKMGQRASDLGEVIFNNVSVNEEDRIGEEDGLKVILKTFEMNRICCAAIAIGVAQRAMQESIKYAQKRTAFGKPIWKNQSIGHMIADMAIQIHGARLMIWHAIWNMQVNGDREKYSSYAKVYATDAATQICINAIQVFGGYGVLKEYPVEKLLRDIKVCQIYEGTSQIQKEIIIKTLMKQANEGGI